MLELSAIPKDQARFFSFIARGEDAVEVSELNLPEDARVVRYYRNGKFVLADTNTILREKDEVVVLTNLRNLKKLGERSHPDTRHPCARQPSLPLVASRLPRQFAFGLRWCGGCVPSLRARPVLPDPDQGRAQ